MRRQNKNIDKKFLRHIKVKKKCVSHVSHSLAFIVKISCVLKMYYDEYDEFLDQLNLTERDLNEFIELDNGESPILRVMSGIQLFVMVLIGLFGNILLINIITFKWKIQTAFNLFLINLAIADILFTAATSLNLITHLFFGEFIFGSIACKVIAFFEHFGPLLSILTIITALIVLQFNVGILISTVVIIFLFIVSSLPAFFQALSYRTHYTQTTDQDDITSCFQIHPTQRAEERLKEIDKTFQIKIPVAVLTIYFILWIVQKMIIGVKTLGGYVYDKLLITMALIYILCWTPTLYFLHNFEKMNQKYALVIMYAVNLLSAVSVIYKPFLYMCMHNGLQKEINRFLQIGSNHPERNLFV